MELNQLEPKKSAEWKVDTRQAINVGIQENERLVRSGLVPLLSPNWIDTWSPHLKNEFNTQLYVATEGLSQLVRERYWPEGSAVESKVEQVAIEIPFNPRTFGREDVKELLPRIHRFENVVQKHILRQTRDLYSDDLPSEEINELDLFNIRQAQLYADRIGYESAVPEFEEIIRSYFQDVDIDQELLVQSVSAGDTVSPDRAKEIYTEEIDRIHRAIDTIYEDRDPETRSELIYEAKMRVLRKLISKIQF